MGKIGFHLGIEKYELLYFLFLSSFGFKEIKVDIPPRCMFWKWFFFSKNIL